MKKLLLAMMAILALVAARPAPANADVIVHSNQNGWDQKGSDFTMTGENGVYTRDIQNAIAGFMFVIIDNGTEYKAMSQPETVVIGKEHETQQTNDYDYNFKIEDSGNYTITYTQSNHKVKVTKTGGDEPQPDTRDMYYKSSAQGWESTKMKSGENYTWTYEVTGSDEFVIVANNTEELKHNEATTTVIFDTPYLLYKNMGDSHNFKIEGTAKYTVTVDASNKDAMTVTVSKDGGDEPGPDTPTPYTGNLKLKFGVGSNWNDGIDMKKDSDWSNNHKWSYTFTAQANTGFVIRDAEGKDHKHATAFTDENPLQFDHAYTLDEGHTDADGGNNFILKDAGSYIVTVDASDKNAMTVTVSKKGGDEPQPSVTYSLWSNIDGDWGKIDFTSHENDIWTKGVENVNGKAFVIKDSDGKEYKPEEATHIYTTTVTKTVAVREGETSGQDFIFETAGKYTITLDASNASNLTVTVTPAGAGDENVDEWPEGAEKFVYFNAGFAWERADRINKGKIYAHFIKKGEDIKDPTDNDWRFEMKDNRDVEGNTNAMLPLFYAPVPENYQEYDGVQFEAENGIVYNTKKCSDYKKYDSEHWFDFIFTADNSVDGIGKVFSAEQSVMTYEQYRVRRDDPNKEALYYLGTNIQGRDGLSNSAAWYETDFSGKVGISQASEGVFMFQLKPTDSKADIKFKMSWVDANTRTKDYNTKYNRTGNAELTGGDKRWWATYNLGLVGPTLAPKYNGSLEDAEYEEQYKPAEGIDGNAAMKYIPRRCRKYSRYCSYDWWIASDMIDDGTYYVIVDTYYKTTALIKYEPKPTLSSLTEDAPRKNETPFSDEDAARYGSQLKGAQVHGTTLVKYANTVSGNATIKPSNNIIELWRENDYQLEYGIYYKIDGTQDESTIISKFNGLKEAERYSIEMDNLPYGKNVQVGVRCTYTDNINNKGDYVAKFRSFTNWKETTNTQQTAVVEASVSQPTAVRFLDNNLWHASASATINVTTSGDLAYYIDIDPDKNNRDHPVRFAEASDFQVQANIGNSHYTASDNNWADPRNGGNIDFVIDNIEDPTSTSYYDATFTVQVPYIVGDLTPTVKYSAEAEGEDNWTDLPAAASVRRRANDAASAIRVDFAPVDVIATVKDMALSGINDVVADGDAEAEYFNLQGVRVRGDIVPGVYIVRRGATVTKEIVK